MAQAVSRRLAVLWLKRLVAANVQSQANPNHRIYGVRNDSAAVFFPPSSSVFPCQYHFTNSPYPYFDMYYRRSKTFARDDVVNPLKPELNPICYLLALLAHHFLHVSRIRVKSLTLR